MTFEQFMNTDMPDSLKEAVIDYQIKLQIKQIEAKQKKMEQFLKAFDDFITQF